MSTTVQNYTIQRGETLTGIAKRHKTTVNNLQKMNEGIIKNVNKIYANQVITVPLFESVNTKTHSATDAKEKQNATTTMVQEAKNGNIKISKTPKTNTKAKSLTFGSILSSIKDGFVNQAKSLVKAVG